METSPNLSTKSQISPYGSGWPPLGWPPPTMSSGWSAGTTTCGSSRFQWGLASSGLIFVAGLSMAISPGRVGELAKSYFLRERAAVPVARSSAAVVAERVMDLVGVLLLSVWGLFLVPYGWLAAILVIARCGCVLLAVRIFLGQRKGPGPSTFRHAGSPSSPTPATRYDSCQGPGSWRLYCL